MARNAVVRGIQLARRVIMSERRRPAVSTTHPGAERDAGGRGLLASVREIALEGEPLDLSSG